MSIKEKIGQRIMNERKAKGLTRKALAELTGELKVSRINNYERGDRTPGPSEIKVLAEALEVSPSYLMCLTDNREGKLTKPRGFGTLIPILDSNQAANPIECIQKINNEAESKIDFIPLSPAISEIVGKNAFVLMVTDESMHPELRISDLIVIDPETKPKPGNFILAKFEANHEAVVRKYKQLSTSAGSDEFELIALNDDWANIHVTSELTCEIIGTVIALNRQFK